MHDERELEPLFAEIERHYTPKRGWCQDELCVECASAEEKILIAKEAARNGYISREVEAEVDPVAIRRVFERGYDKGRQIALQEAHRWAAQSAERAEVAARNKWYQQGLREGRASAVKTAAPSPVDRAAVRREQMDEVLQECRVIGESNPGMNPAMNALRHRLKKLNR